MPDMPVPVLSRYVPRQERFWLGRSRLEAILLVSLLVHALLLAIILLAKHLGGHQAPPQDPGYEIVFDQGQQSPNAVPAPSKSVEVPNGETAPPVAARSQQAEPAPPPTEQQPQVNLMPPEYAMEQPPPPQQEAEPLPRPVPRPPRPRPSRSSNPFAGMPIYGAPSEAPQRVPRGLRGSHSMNLALGLDVQGGQLREAVPHVSSPGADGDYLERLSDYVETHKFYPELAAKNREAGVAVIKATILRDGTVKDVRLVESSGSRTLDMAWMGMFRAKHLPPFPDDMRENQRDFTLSMDYEIVYQ
jgi:protein TonB